MQRATSVSCTPSDCKTPPNASHSGPLCLSFARPAMLPPDSWTNCIASLQAGAASPPFGTLKNDRGQPAFSAAGFRSLRTFAAVHIACERVPDPAACAVLLLWRLCGTALLHIAPARVGTNQELPWRTFLSFECYYPHLGLREEKHHVCMLARCVLPTVLPTGIANEIRSFWGNTTSVDTASVTKVSYLLPLYRIAIDGTLRISGTGGQLDPSFQ